MAEFADLVDLLRKGQLLHHQGTESFDSATQMTMWKHSSDCVGCRARHLLDAMVAAMEYRPCVRFDMEPCRSRPELPEEDWCPMCWAVELRARG